MLDFEIFIIFAFIFKGECKYLIINRMRYITFLLIFLFLSHPLYARDEAVHESWVVVNDGSSPLVTQDLYKQTKEWKTSKIFRIAGWSALGVGLPTAFYGAVGLAIDNQSGGIGKGNPFVAVLIAGGTLTLSSIPLFIVSHRYKKKAMNKVDIGLTPIYTPSYTGNTVYTPAVNFSIRF